MFNCFYGWILTVSSFRNVIPEQSGFTYFPTFVNLYCWRYDMCAPLPLVPSIPSHTPQAYCTIVCPWVMHVCIQILWLVSPHTLPPSLWDSLCLSHAFMPLDFVCQFLYVFPHFYSSNHLVWEFVCPIIKGSVSRAFLLSSFCTALWRHYIVSIYHKGFLVITLNLYSVGSKEKEKNTQAWVV